MGKSTFSREKYASLVALSCGLYYIQMCSTSVPKITEKGHQTTYSQRILLSFLRRGITNLAIGGKRSVTQYPALAANP